MAIQRNLDDDILTLKGKGRLINNELEIAETLNSHHINIIKTTCRQHPQTLGSPKHQANGHASINQIKKIL